MRTAVPDHQDQAMLTAGIALLVVALIAALFGFTGMAKTAAGVAKIVFFIAIIAAVFSFAMHACQGRV